MVGFADVNEAVMSPLAPVEARYRPLLELGRGGTARVYLAESLTSGLRKLVVLKTLTPELAVEPEMRELFRREAEVCARLNHPNIVQIHEIVEQASGPVIVMEYVEGVSLAQVVSMSQGRLPKRLHLHAITQLLAGLHYFHELKDYDRTTALNPVHRDVSPQNVVVMYEGAIKVLDFGIAKLANQEQATATGVVKGKLHYMPSEQLLSDATLDRRADIFSAGVMLWEALASRRMWTGMSENAIFQALLRDELPSLREAAPELPSHFYDVVTKATARDKEDRYATALELQLEVEKMLQELGGLVQPRELASFMQTEFGEWRKSQEAAVATAGENPVTARWGITGTQRFALEEQEARERSNSSSAHSKEIQAPAARKRIWTFWVLGALGFAGLLGLALLRERAPAPAAPTSASASGTVREVNLSVNSHPVGAHVFIDGKPLGRTPWQGKLKSRQQLAVLELRADSCLPLSKVLSLSEDVSIDVPLEPLPKLVPSAAPMPEKTVKPANKPARGVRPTELKPPARDANCNPPYTLSSDGIRTYKPECF